MYRNSNNVKDYELLNSICSGQILIHAELTGFMTLFYVNRSFKKAAKVVQFNFKRYDVTNRVSVFT